MGVYLRKETVEHLFPKGWVLSLSRPSIAFLTFGDIDSTMFLRAKELGTWLSVFGWEVVFLGPFRVVPTVTENSPKYIKVRQSARGYYQDLTRLRRDFQPDFLHVLNPSLKAFIAQWVFSNSKVVADWEDWNTNPENPSVVNPVFKWVDRWFLHNATIVVTCSRWLQKHFQHLRDYRGDVHYIPYAPLSVRWPDELPAFNNPTCVFMGNLYRSRDHDILLSACDVMYQFGSSPHVVFIGGGEDLSRCRDYVKSKRLRNVQFLGRLPLDQMLGSLKAAHVLAFPIRNNVANLARCPFKVFQYAQARRPIITSSVGEVETFLGDKAIYVEATPEAMADAILSVLSSPRLEDVDYGIERQTWESRARTLHAILMKAMG